LNYVTYAIPFFVLLMLVEYLWGRFTRHQTYRLNDTLNSLSMGLLSRVVDLLRLGFAGIVIEAIVRAAGVQQVNTEPMWVWIAAFVAYDFCYYWKHRFGHEWRILWASHVAHHQSEEFNLSTALRQTGTDYIGFVFYIPLYLAGLPVEVVITVGSLNLIYQFWVHTEHIRRLGPIEWVFVTPSNHRVHHAKNPDYIDKNYGGVFILWDRMFGTFENEREDNPCYYGITHALHSWNPIWANLHMWVETAQLAWRTRRWRDKFLVWFKPPSWIPEDLPREHYDWQAPKYDPPSTPFLKAYCFTNYWLITVAGLAAVLAGDMLSALMALTAFVVVAVTLFSHGRLLEGRDDAMKIELGRLGFLLVLAVVQPQAWPALPEWLSPAILAYVVASFGALVISGAASHSLPWSIRSK